MAPRVSVVLPTHNRADLLPVAVESVRSQTFSDWELILVDDGSTDDTPQVVKSFVAQDSRIRSVRNDPNIRLPRALNRGFSEARGELLTWTSDDNLYLPEALEKMVAALDGSLDVGLVYAGMTVVDDDLKPLYPWACLPVEEQPVQPWVGACFLYRRSVMEAVGDYDPGTTLAEDLDYWIRVRLQFPMLALPETLYLYRDHPGSLSSLHSAKVHAAGAKVVRKHLPGIHWLRPAQRATTLLGLANQALRDGDRAESRRWTLEALRAHPQTVWRTFKRGLVRVWLGL